VAAMVLPCGEVGILAQTMLTCTRLLLTALAAGVTQTLGPLMTGDRTTQCQRQCQQTRSSCSCWLKPASSMAAQMA
jgi:hypothetical protein